MDKKYLRKRGNTWHYRRRIPKSIQPYFNGEEYLNVNLHTGDIKTARLRRSEHNYKIDSMLDKAVDPDRARFRNLAQQMAQEKENRPEDWQESWGDEIFLATAYRAYKREAHRAEMLDLAPPEWNGPLPDQVLVDAYATVNGKRDCSGKYGVTLKEGLELWLKRNQRTKDKSTVSKVKQSVKKFLQHLNKFDVPLADIKRKQAYDYIEFLIAEDYKAATCKGFLSRLGSVWDHCKDLGAIEGESPFKDHKYDHARKGEKFKLFDEHELQWLKENAWTDQPEYRLMLELGVYTGARISELANLKRSNVLQGSGFYALSIQEGKTEAATRRIPLPDFLADKLLQHLDERPATSDEVFSFDNKKASREFSRIKTEHLSKDPHKGFHSLRVRFCTVLERSHLPEKQAAVLAGHKKGESMTYGYYSKGYTLEQLNEFYNSCLHLINW